MVIDGIVPLIIRAIQQRHLELDTFNEGKTVGLGRPRIQVSNTHYLKRSPWENRSLSVNY